MVKDEWMCDYTVWMIVEKYIIKNEKKYFNFDVPVLFMNNWRIEMREIFEYVAN
jgi:hypothetical protein